MATKVGNLDLASAYIEDRQVSKIMFNNVEVYSSAPVSSPDSIESASPISYYTPESIVSSGETDGSNVTAWNDTIGSNNLTVSNGQPTVINDGGIKMVQFDGVDDHLQTSVNTIFNFVPQTDEFTIVFKVGSTLVNDGGTGTITKTDGGSSGTHQYMLSIRDTRETSYVGGTGGNYAGGGAVGNDLAILTVSTTTQTWYFNGVTRGTFGVGSYTNSESFTVGGRAGSSPTYQNVRIERIAVFDKVLSAGEISAIHTEFNVN